MSGDIARDNELKYEPPSSTSLEEGKRKQVFNALRIVIESGFINETTNLSTLNTGTRLLPPDVTALATTCKRLQKYAKPISVDVEMLQKSTLSEWTKSAYKEHARAIAASERFLYRPGTRFTINCIAAISTFAVITFMIFQSLNFGGIKSYDAAIDNLNTCLDKNRPDIDHFQHFKSSGTCYHSTQIFDACKRMGGLECLILCENLKATLTSMCDLTPFKCTIMLLIPTFACLLSYNSFYMSTVNRIPVVKISAEGQSPVLATQAPNGAYLLLPTHEPETPQRVPNAVAGAPPLPGPEDDFPYHLLEEGL